MCVCTECVFSHTSPTTIGDPSSSSSVRAFHYYVYRFTRIARYLAPATPHICRAAALPEVVRSSAAWTIGVDDDLTGTRHAIYHRCRYRPRLSNGRKVSPCYWHVSTVLGSSAAVCDRLAPVSPRRPRLLNRKNTTSRTPGHKSYIELHAYTIWSTHTYGDRYDL